MSLLPCDGGVLRKWASTRKGRGFHGRSVQFLSRGRVQPVLRVHLRHMGAALRLIDWNASTGRLFLTRRTQSYRRRPRSFTLYWRVRKARSVASSHCISNGRYAVTVLGIIVMPRLAVSALAALVSRRERREMEEVQIEHEVSSELMPEATTIRPQSPVCILQHDAMPQWINRAFPLSRRLNNSTMVMPLEEGDRS